MDEGVRRYGIRSKAERGVFGHEAWPGLMKLLRQTAENTAGVSIKHPKLVGGLGDVRVTVVLAVVVVVSRVGSWLWSSFRCYLHQLLLIGLCFAPLVPCCT